MALVRIAKNIQGLKRIRNIVLLISVFRERSYLRTAAAIFVNYTKRLISMLVSVYQMSVLVFGYCKKMVTAEDVQHGQELFPMEKRVGLHALINKQSTVMDLVKIALSINALLLTRKAVFQILAQILKR